MNESAQERRDKGKTFAGMAIGSGLTFGGMKGHQFVKANGGYRATAQTGKHMAMSLRDMAMDSMGQVFKRGK